LSTFELSIWVLAATCFATWLLSVITREYSWVDRIWSIIPIVYAWVFASQNGFTDPRLNVMASLVTLWGARLTFNFARKGGYAPGGEDYRWEELRKSMKPWVYQVFNVFFIVIFQNVLLWLITLPIWVASATTKEFGTADLVCAVGFLILLATETIADQQQLKFQNWKKAERAAGREAHPRFLTTGLFAVSRHPNFFSEQAQWWMLFIWGATTMSSVLHWSIVGCVLLSALFVGSTRFTEELSLRKYPEYAEYQKRVSALVPWWPRRASELQAD
jgi:steroid 5-alpha reductase family enzyme